MMIQQKPNDLGLNLVYGIFMKAMYNEGILLGVSTTTILCDFGKYTVIVYADGVKRTINNSFFNSKEHCREILESILENE